MKTNDNIVQNSADNGNSQNVDIALLIRFIRHMKLPELFDALPDTRQQSKITYSISSIALYAFATCIFRQGSKNVFHTTFAGLPSEQREGILHLLGIQCKTLPHYTTVDDALTHINYREFNHILLEIFALIVKRKMFYNHPLLPNNSYLIGTDGYHLHTYTHPHAIDEHGNNCCPYCLPRKRHAGTEKEEVYWVHITVTFVMICYGFTIPIYIHPLRAQQVNVDQSDDKLKQECELIAARIVLPLIRGKFPKLPLTFMGDSLYANRPFLRFCNQLDFDYRIVRKENSLPSLGDKCDELAKIALYKAHYTHQGTITDHNKTVKCQYAWFNKVDISDKEGELTTNVLRFKEQVFGENTESQSRYKGEWICSTRIVKNNCERVAEEIRMRWNHEDLHNTGKNRGFDISHDMARAKPNLLFVWKMMTFLAMCVFELFSLTTVARTARKHRSLMKFAQDMLQQLVNIAWAKIKSSAFLQKQKVQFRFLFDTS